MTGMNLGEKPHARNAGFIGWVLLGQIPFVSLHGHLNSMLTLKRPIAWFDITLGPRDCGDADLFEAT